MPDSAFYPALSRLNLSDTDLVSFDIFDTAVLRLLARPKDLFKVIEKKYNIPFFYKNRCLAARLARKENKKNGIPEITLNEIYDKIQILDPSITAEKSEKLKQAETDLELRLCQRNEEIGALFEYVKKMGKRVCFVSDMYLPKETIEKILIKCGYTEYDALYLSSIDKLTKADGERFKTCVSPERILHIGDNKKSDFIAPLRANVNAFLYRKSRHRFLSDRLIKKSKKQNDLYLSFVCALAKQADFKSYWYSIGYQYVAPLLTCFCIWLKKEMTASPVDKLCFLARDGMIMPRVWKILFSDESLYLYCSRALTTNTDCQKIYIEYLSTLELTNAHFAIVDVGRNGTIQNNLKNMLPKAIIDGYYVDLRSEDADKKGFYTNGLKKYRRFLDFLDFLFIAPDPLCISIQKNASTYTPVFLPVDTDEKKRHEIAGEIHCGVCSFVQKAAAFKDIFTPDTPPDILAETLKCLFNFEKSEKRHLEGIKIPFGKKNEKSRYLITPAFSIKDHLLHPVSFFKLWRKSVIKRFL